VMHGSFFTTPPEARSVCDRFRRIFVAHHGVLVAIDAPRGRVLWQARLPDRVATSPGDATLVGDETCLRDVGGAIVVRTEDERVTAFDRDTGAALWQRACDGVPQNDTASLLLPQGHRVWDLVRPRDGGTVARFAASEARLVRGAVVLAVDGTGRANDAGGVALADAQTGREHWFVAAEDPELHTGVALVGDRLWVPQNGTTGTLLLPIELATGKAPGAGLFARLFGIRGARGVALPWTKHNLTALWGAGDAIVVDAAAWDGQRRIALVEPRGMRVRHDSGVIPDGVAPGVRLGPGMLVYAFGESNGPKTVRAVDLATGVLRWERQLPDLDDIAFRVGALTFRTDGGPIEIVDPATGQTKVTFGH
jgi:outer membrane protein assembly factor BamB